MEWTFRLGAWTFDLYRGYFKRLADWLRQSPLRDLNPKEKLRSAGVGGVGHSETAAGIKIVCDQRRPVCQWCGDIGRRQHGVSSVGRAAGSAKDQVATQQSCAGDHWPRWRHIQ